MFDVALPELLVIAAVALVVIGPKDIPKVMHKIGQWTGTARRALLALQHDMERLDFEAQNRPKTSTFGDQKSTSLSQNDAKTPPREGQS